MPDMPPIVLVVDDEPQVRKVVRSVLEADGYEVTEAADGPAALLLLNSIGGPRGPQLVVLDVMMPGLDGIEVCRQIPHDRMKVMMLTARDDARDPPAGRGRRRRPLHDQAVLGGRAPRHGAPAARLGVSDADPGADGPGEDSLGAFIKDQRRRTRLSMRQLAEAAGVSNPYLSQIERGLRRPSADILRQIARGLSISAESLYVRAGILDRADDEVDVITAIERDTVLTVDHRAALIRIYRSFRAEVGQPVEAAGPTAPDPVPGQETSDDRESTAGRQR